ncbi:NAD(P)/FAD-dependent oxidoreductase [Rhizobium paknamense]|uniref:NADH:ubiquinone reductase (non-electrogenic) n=1 Tax=Rhizobium paknamense TaxID=1206817 RepID=A0ABU0IBI9_9HYPH|nr:NAD(P)/FAD-dependent oxidoreductase [Rhizobium paknamense]MDQ0455595.1 NADH dehydrogenase [Rhizobium paknamense]
MTGKTRQGRSHVVIIGGGFGGLACARELGNRDVDVTLIDRRNHNLFQPLLYQVATAALSPADIAEPIRRTLGRYRNVKVLLGEVHGVDAASRTVSFDGGRWISYDYLVIATGSEYNYFGHEDWRPLAPGLKTIHEARLLRQRLLLAFEKAERSTDREEQKALLTSVVIGGGPTGVEMAGAISELGQAVLKQDFRQIDASLFRVLLVEAGPKLLAAFPETLTDYAKNTLENMGVQIRLGASVSQISPNAVQIGEKSVRAGCIVWAAGIRPSPAAQWLGLETVARGRIPVDMHLSVVDCPDVYALGDTSQFLDEHGKPVPALAQVAKQQGRYLGRSLLKRMAGEAEVKPFRFHNRGNTAVIGRHAAVFDFGRWQMKGRLAWFLWAVVHVLLLVNFEKRILVSLQWMWRYLTHNIGARLIDENTRNIPATTDIQETLR